MDGRQRWRFSAATRRASCFPARCIKLFRSAADLTTMGCEIAVIARANSGHVLTFGRPDVESVARRYLHDDDDLNLASDEDDDVDMTDADGAEPEEIAKSAEAAAEVVPREEELDGCWWKRPVEGMELEELQEFERSLVALRNKAEERESLLRGDEQLSQLKIA